MRRSLYDTSDDPFLSDIRKSKALLIIDEGHHSAANTWNDAIVMWRRRGGSILGMTATPWRMSNEEGFPRYTKLITGPTLHDLVQQGYLSNIEYYSTVHIPITGRGTRAGGDYNYSSTELYYGNRLQSATKGIVKEALGRANGRRIVVFTMTRNHAHMTGKIFESLGVTSAVLESRVKKDIRKGIVEDFRAGKIQVIVNIDILTEGFDCPDAYMCLMLRPTRSLALYLQMIGRVTRVSDDIDHCVVLDAAKNYAYFAQDNGLEVPFCADGGWSLQPRGSKKLGNNGNAPMKGCPSCGNLCHTSVKYCHNCNYSFGRICSTCDSWRVNNDFEINKNTCIPCTREAEVELERVRLAEKHRKELEREQAELETLKKLNYTLTKKGNSFFRRGGDTTTIIGRMKRKSKDGSIRYFCTGMVQNAAKAVFQHWNLKSFSDAHRTSMWSWTRLGKFFDFLSNDK